MSSYPALGRTRRDWKLSNFRKLIMIEKADFNELFSADLYRYGGNPPAQIREFLFFLRKCQTCSFPFVKWHNRKKLRSISDKLHLEISFDNVIGKGLYIGHCYGITINRNAVLGDNINISKGVTIGQENRGARKGTPTIGDRVWIGVNATIVGNIRVGEDVMIAPNSFVNFDVPPHSIVLGNPGRIIHRDNATEGYLHNLVG